MPIEAQSGPKPRIATRDTLETDCKASSYRAIPPSGSSVVLRLVRSVFRVEDAYDAAHTRASLVNVTTYIM